MKRSLVISAAALAAFALVGCNTGNSDPQPVSWHVLSKMQEVTNGVVTITEHEWNDETDSKVSETQKVNGFTVYSNTGYASSNTGTYTEYCYRESYFADGTPPLRSKLVTTYGDQYMSKPLETRYEEFILSGPDADETNPAIRNLTEWNGQGNHREVQHFAGDTRVLHQRNFRYDSGGFGYTYEESVDGGEYVDMCLKVTKRSNSTLMVTEYELYRDWDGSKGTVIEKKTDFEVPDEFTIKYKITRYDNEGENPVVTDVTETYEYLTVEFK